MQTHQTSVLSTSHASLIAPISLSACQLEYMKLFIWYFACLNE